MLRWGPILDGPLSKAVSLAAEEARKRNRLPGREGEIGGGEDGEVHGPDGGGGSSLVKIGRRVLRSLRISVSVVDEEEEVDLVGTKASFAHSDRNSEFQIKKREQALRADYTPRLC
jgi:hypothetical protein